MTDRDETERLKAEVARLQKKSELHKQAADRWFPCPDHRDKRELVDGCTVCQIERLQAEVARLRAALLGYQQWEADLIMHTPSWCTSNGLPILTQAQMDRLTELQLQRNEALKEQP
jgi:uncharacterized small protein (DUF1192 family)